MKEIKDCQDLPLKCDFLLLTNFFEKFGNTASKIMDYIGVII